MLRPKSDFWLNRYHRQAEYERGKPNLSTLDLVRDTTHMW